jgi:hypothetical protein
MGNGIQTVGYEASGTAADWMLGTLNIATITLELGTSKKNSNRHMLRGRSVIRDVVN